MKSFIISILLIVTLYIVIIGEKWDKDIKNGKCPKCKHDIKYVNSGKYQKFYCTNCTWMKEYINGMEIKMKDNYEAEE